MDLTLSELHVYPVKSCGGFRTAGWEVDEFGLRLDRRWMVVNERGHFHTQRTRPRLAQVRTALSGQTLTLEAPGMETIAVAPGGGDTLAVGIWDDVCVAEQCERHGSEWMSDLLGEAVQLVFMPDATRRLTRRRREESLGRVGFQDAYPFLLVGAASLDDLNTRLDAPLPMNRFRPNLVVNGSAAYAEDGWNRCRIGDIDLVVTKPCERCGIPTIDQDTGESGKEPLRTLALYRRVGDAVTFGINLSHRNAGSLRIGDAVTPAS
jgi:uncharacterized protein YcbX